MYLIFLLFADESKRQHEDQLILHDNTFKSMIIENICIVNIYLNYFFLKFFPHHHNKDEYSYLFN